MASSSAPLADPVSKPGQTAAALSLALAAIPTAFILFLSFRAESARWVAVAALLFGSVLIAPVVAVWLHSHRAVAAIRMGAAITLSAASLFGFAFPPGLFYLPAALAMWISFAQTGGQPVPRARLAWWLTFASLVLAVAAVLALTFLPTVERCRAETVVRGNAPAVSTEPSCSSLNLIETGDFDALGVMLVPVVLILATVLFPRGKVARNLRIVCSLVLLALVLLGILSVGLFFAPAALAMTAAASLDPGDRAPIPAGFP